MNAMTTGVDLEGALRRALAVAVLTAGTVGATMTVHVPTASAQKDMQKARKSFKRGKRLYEQEKYEEAVDAFKTAYKYSDRSELLYNIGKSYHESGELAKAEEYFQKYLDKNPEASNRGEVTDKIVEIQQELAAQMASVEVSSSEGDSVFVGDEEKPRCTAPCTVSLEPGSHEIRVESGGEAVGTKTVEVSKGGTKAVAFEGATAGPTGKLHVRTQSGGGVLRVDGEQRANLPMSEPVEVPAGSRQLEVTESSGAAWTGEVSIGEEETTRLLVSAGSASDTGGGGASAKRSIAYLLGGASVALIGGGLLLGQSAKQTHDILSEQQRRGAVDSDLVDKGRREMVTANILLGAGSAALLSGAGLFTWDLVGSGGD